MAWGRAVTSMRPMLTCTSRWAVLLSKRDKCAGGARCGCGATGVNRSSSAARAGLGSKRSGKASETVADGGWSTDVADSCRTSTPLFCWAGTGGTNGLMASGRRCSKGSESCHRSRTGAASGGDGNGRRAGSSAPGRESRRPNRRPGCGSSADPGRPCSKEGSSTAKAAGPIKRPWSEGRSGGGVPWARSTRRWRYPLMASAGCDRQPGAKVRGPGSAARSSHSHGPDREHRVAARGPAR